MQLQEKVARDLRRSTVVLTTTSARAGGDYGGGVGTIVGDRYVLTTKHCITGSRVYIWHPEDELKQDFRIVRSWSVGENSLVEVDKKLPFPSYPVSRKAVSEVMNPGANIVYPGGYEFYTMTEDYQMPMNVGIYNGPAGGNRYLAWGRMYHGTSGSGVVSLEDQVLVGIVYGVILTTHGGSQDNIIFWGVNNLAANLDQVGIPSPEGVSTVPMLGEQILPETQNKYVQWGIMGLAGIGGVMIAKSLLE